MFHRQDLKAGARFALRKNYGPAVLTGLILSFVNGSLATSSSNNNVRDNITSPRDISTVGIYEGFLNATDKFFKMLPFFLLIVVAVTVLFILINTFLLNPIEVGAIRFFMLNRDGNPSPKELLFAFGGNYFNIVKVMFIKDLYTALWALLFILPGIIKSYSYKMVPFLLANEPSLSAHEAISSSMEIMYGNKFATFVLDLSFIGWMLLSGMTFGLTGVFYSNPYYYATIAELYHDLTKEPNHTSSGYYGNRY